MQLDTAARQFMIRDLSIGLVLALLAGVASARAEAPASSDQAHASVFRVDRVLGAEPGVVKLDRRHLRSLVRDAGGSGVLVELPVEDGVELELAAFAVVRAGTQFVVGRLGGADVPVHTFDPAAVTVLRGPVRGAGGAAEQAYIAFDDRHVMGHITVEGRRYELTTAAPGLAADEALLSSAPVGRFPLPPDVPLCGTETAETVVGPSPRAEAAPRRGMKRIELAVETDYEFYARFNDLDAAAFYAVALYGAVSDIYIRDLNAHIELTFVRLWDTPADMFNDPDPLMPFRTWWNANMGGVPRDAAQFLTGRRDLPYGGVAWLSSLCAASGYSVAGLINGTFDPSLAPGAMQWDIFVPAHELAHNCGTLHTHNYGLDSCVGMSGPSVEQRGTIMSYCHIQNGGGWNVDLRFHAGVQQVVIPFLAESACIENDCNANGVDDALDVSAGSSPDSNLNGVPDECEDCDGDGTLDDAAIAAGTPDVDSNGVPDECQPDCNANGLPDAWEIIQGLADDDNGNFVPDACEPDCDGDGVADHVQIRANMHLDVNRNVVLDACEDCDGSGVLDLAKLDGAHEIWVVGSNGTQAHAYHGGTGALRVATTGGLISEAKDVVISPAGTVLVASGGNWRVIEYDRPSGAFIRNFVSTGSGGMRYPAGLAFGPDGHLYVSSRDTDAIFKYDGASGAFIAQFVVTNVGGLVEPYGLTFGPNGDLFVSSGATNQVLEYDGATGAFVRVFVPAGSGGLSAPRGLAFKHDGSLLVASSETGEVLEYARTTGAFVGVFNQPFASLELDFDAWGLAIGANGNVFVTRAGPEYLVFELETQTGLYLQAFVRGPYSGLNVPTGIAFVPGFATDCNRNQLPDSCEIFSGAAADANANNVLDVCEVDCDANGVYDWLEIIPRGTRLDCNFNGVLDDCEIASGHPAPGACCASLGDFDADGDFDLVDVHRLMQCAGADVTARNECACANLNDANTIIDAGDWALLEAMLSGPL